MRNICCYCIVLLSIYVSSDLLSETQLCRNETVMRYFSGYDLLRNIEREFNTKNSSARRSADCDSLVLSQYQMKEMYNDYSNVIEDELCILKYEHNRAIERCNVSQRSVMRLTNQTISLNQSLTNAKMYYDISVRFLQALGLYDMIGDLSFENAHTKLPSVQVRLDTYIHDYVSVTPDTTTGISKYVRIDRDKFHPSLELPGTWLKTCGTMDVTSRFILGLNCTLNFEDTSNPSASCANLSSELSDLQHKYQQCIIMSTQSVLGKQVSFNGLSCSAALTNLEMDIAKANDNSLDRVANLLQELHNGANYDQHLLRENINQYTSLIFGYKNRTQQVANITDFLFRCSEALRNQSEVDASVSNEVEFVYSAAQYGLLANKQNATQVALSRCTTDLAYCRNELSITRDNEFSTATNLTSCLTGVYLNDGANNCYNHTIKVTQVIQETYYIVLNICFLSKENKTLPMAPSGALYGMVTDHIVETFQL